MRGQSKLRSEAIRLVEQYMKGEREAVARIVVKRANTVETESGDNILFEMWKVLEDDGYSYDPHIAELLADVQAESLRWYERGELCWQKNAVSPGT